MNPVKKTKVTAEIGYIMGHLRCGHFEAMLTDEELAEMQALPKDKQVDYLREVGEIEVDDYEIDDYGDVGEVEIAS